MYALLLDMDNRVIEVMDIRDKTDATPVVDYYPDGLIFDYRYENGQYIHDPIPREKRSDSAQDVLNSLVLGDSSMDRLQAAEQLRKALQMFAGSLPEEQALEVVAVFDPWEAGKQYKEGDRFTYGVNGVGDPQLYTVNQAHTSQADWLPDQTPALYTPIGLDSSGYPVWSQPTGAHDAYNTGDIVNHEGILYISKIEGNSTVPGTDDRYWSLYEK